MSDASISNGITTITPILIDGYKSARASRNIRHAIINTNAPAFSLRPAALRTGALRALFATRAAAAEFETMLAAAQQFTLVAPDAPTLNMTFVIDDGGEIEVELDDEDRESWWVVFPFGEVS